MRDPKRIKEFCIQLAQIWEINCPDWRFGQLVSNVFCAIGFDPFYVEEDQMMECFKKYFNKKEEHNT